MAKLKKRNKKNKSFIVSMYQRGGRRAFAPYFPQPNPYGSAVITPTGFIPTYAGQPLEQFNQTADLLKQEYDTNVARYDAVQAWLAEQNALEGDRQSLETAFQPYRDQLADIAQTGRYERMGPQVRALAAQASQDPYIRAIQESYQRGEEARKISEEMRAKGIQQLYYKNPADHQTISVDPETGEKTINIFSSQAEQQLDWAAPKREIANQIKSDSFDTTPQRVTDILAGYIKMGRISGISTDKIARKLQSMMTSYEGTPEFQQEFRYYTTPQEQGGLGMTAEDARANIVNEMFAAGDLITFQNQNAKYMKDLIFEANQKAKAGGPGLPGLAGPVPIEQPALQQGEPGGLFSDDDFSPIMKVDLNKFDPSKQRGGFKGGVESFTFAEDEANQRIAELKETYGDRFDELYDVTRGLGHIRIVPKDHLETYTEEERRNLRDESITPEEQQQFEKIVTAYADLYNIPIPDMGSPEAFGLAKAYQEQIGDNIQTFLYNTADDARAAYRRDITGKKVGNVEREELRKKQEANLDRHKFTSKYFDPETNQELDEDDIEELLDNKSNLILKGSVNPASYIPPGIDKSFADSYLIEVRDKDGNNPRELWMKAPEKDAYKQQVINLNKVAEAVRLPEIPNEVQIGTNQYTLKRLISGGVGVSIDASQVPALQQAGFTISRDRNNNNFVVYPDVNTLYTHLSNIK